MMQLKKSYTLAIVLICIVAVAFAAYFFWFRPPSDSIKEELVIAMPTAWKHWDPTVETSDSCMGLQEHVFETLLQTDAADTAGLKRTPVLAISWSQYNATTVEFKLRKGVKYHCGREFTAEDIVWGFEKFLNPEHPTAYRYLQAKYFEVVDDYTIRLGSDEPMCVSVLIPYLHMHFAIECPVCYGGDALDTAVKACGTGPYMLVDYKAGEYAKLERFDGYWGGVPNNRIKYITVRFIPDTTARILALESGQVDLIHDVLPTEMKRLEDEGFTTNVFLGTRTQQLLINTRKPPFNDLRVRQAINYAINRAEIAETLFQGMGKPADCPISPLSDGYRPIWPTEYNPDKATALLSEAGYPNGFDCTIRTVAGRYLLDKENVEAVAAYLGQVGIKAKVETYDWATYTAMLKTESGKLIPDCDMYFIGWAADSSYKLCNGNLYGRPTAYNGTGTFNGMGYYNEEIEELVRRIEEGTEADYVPLNKQIMDVLVLDLPCAPLIYQTYTQAHIPELKGAMVPPYEAPRLWDAYFESSSADS